MNNIIYEVDLGCLVCGIPAQMVDRLAAERDKLQHLKCFY